MEIMSDQSKYRLLWASPFCLHDTSSGAALQCRLMLECLAARGIEVTVLGALVFDDPIGTSLFPDFSEQVKNAGDSWLGLKSQGISYSYLKCASTAIEEMKQSESSEFFARFNLMLKLQKPDVVAMYGGGPLEYAIRAEAAASGVPTVYALFNGNHAGYAFPYTDLVITDSQATARYYALASNINVQAGGIFISPESCVSPERAPHYVTFVNPCPEKGVAAFARLALMAAKAMPEVRFLVVQSRGRWEQALQNLRDEADPDFRLCSADFANVDVAPHQADMRPVYRVTRALLAPSLWYEGWGRVATEATLNGIPVLASASGGLPEAVGEGGLIVPLPEASCRNHLRIPTEEEMLPWLQALAQLLDPAREEEWREKALSSAARHSMKISTQRVLRLLLPLLRQRAGNRPQLFRTGASVAY